MSSPSRAKRAVALAAAVLSFGGCARGQMTSLADIPADTMTLMYPGTLCADGSSFKFLVRKGTSNANRVLIDFMGGGVCWGDRCFEDASTAFQSSSGGFNFYLDVINGMTTAAARGLLSGGGTGGATFMPIGFGTDVQGAAPPSTWTYVFVPYCTQDIHMGDCWMDYQRSSDGSTRTVRHGGAANVRAVMDWVYSNFPAPQTIALVGCSAGASAVPVTEAARASAHYGAGTTVVAVGDSPSNLLTEQFVRDGLPSWGLGPYLANLTGLNLSAHLGVDLLADAMGALFDQHPGVQFAYYTRTEDATQLQYHLSQIRLGAV
jgi:hypothetical protein